MCGVSRAGRRLCRAVTAVAVVAVCEGTERGADATEVKAVPSIAGEVLCFILVNAAHIEAKEL